MAAVSPRPRDDLLLAIAIMGPLAATALTTLKALSRPPLATRPVNDALWSTLSSSRLLSSATVSVGSTASARAATPATWGVAMLVPLSVPYRLPGTVL